MGGRTTGRLVADVEVADVEVAGVDPVHVDRSHLVVLCLYDGDLLIGAAARTPRLWHRPP
jgi:hypothetical protein